jgi:hypothetical protein
MTSNASTTWRRVAVPALCVEDLKSVLRSGWSIAYGDHPFGFRSGVFSRPAPDATVTFYFSPAAQELAEAFGAVPCDKPPNQHVTMVAGDHRSWEACFQTA